MPVHCRQFGGERGKLKILRPHGRLHNQILSATVLFKDIVVVENPLLGAAVLREDHDQPGPEFAAQVLCDGPNVGITEKKINFVLTLSAHGLNLLAELLPKRFKHC